MKAVILLFLCFVTSLTRADTWMPLGHRVFCSPDGTWLLRADGSGTAVLLKWQKEDAGYAVHKTIAFSSKAEPLSLAVGNSGRIVALDCSFAMGSDRRTVEVYSPEGALLKSWQLEDIFSADEIAAFAKTTSSVWWRDIEVKVTESDWGFAVVTRPVAQGFANSPKKVVRGIWILPDKLEIRR